ncbi:MAG: decaprenyl-phosphate phosphoribosyltransferase [Deltaproteobacteria bacterium]|nr:decaprenyl-phosphate phosphoribosyltransferase [Deltaproteobacteria bacterium]
MAGIIREITTSMRPAQWVKNLFVVAPVLFAKKRVLSGEFEVVVEALLAFAAFIFVSGAIYILNDIMDSENDRLHPVKKFRPIPAGRLSINAAIFGAGILLSAAMIIGLSIGKNFLLAASLYLLLNAAYSFYMKKFAYVDVTCIAAGFMLRIIAGCFAIELPVSEISYWLLLCTFLLALFLGLGKRRHELLISDENSLNHRSSLRQYSSGSLNIMMYVIAVITILAYFSYTISGRTIEYFGTGNLVFTVPFVGFGLYRFMKIVHTHKEAVSATDVMVKDVPLVVNIILWGATALWVIYFQHG